MLSAKQYGQLFWLGHCPCSSVAHTSPHRHDEFPGSMTTPALAAPAITGYLTICTAKNTTGGRRGVAGIEPTTSRTLSENHTTRPNSLAYPPFVHARTRPYNVRQGRAGVGRGVGARGGGGWGVRGSRGRAGRCCRTRTHTASQPYCVRQGRAGGRGWVAGRGEGGNATSWPPAGPLLATCHSVRQGRGGRRQGGRGRGVAFTTGRPMIGPRVAAMPAVAVDIEKAWDRLRGAPGGDRDACHKGWWVWYRTHPNRKGPPRYGQPIHQKNIKRLRMRGIVRGARGRQRHPTLPSRGDGCGTTPRPEGTPCKKPKQTKDKAAPAAAWCMWPSGRWPVLRHKPGTCGHRRWQQPSGRVASAHVYVRAHMQESVPAGQACGLRDHPSREPRRTRWRQQDAFKAQGSGTCWGPMPSTHRAVPDAGCWPEWMGGWGAPRGWRPSMGSRVGCGGKPG